MKNKFTLSLAAIGFIGLGVFLAACEKDYAAPAAAPVTSTASASFVEEFNKVGELAAKGWIIKNNSNPAGGTAWRQGRYETSTKFPVDYIGFPAFSADHSPTDFVSCDVSATGLEGDISAWLISPPMTIKTGDVISFYSRSLDDANFVFAVADRVQVRANFSGDGSSDVGTSATAVGKFTSLLLDINRDEIENFFGGYPETWTKSTITVSGLSAPVTNARFAFRYLRRAGGLYDGVSAGLVGVDQLSFQSK